MCIKNCINHDGSPLSISLNNKQIFSFNHNHDKKGSQKEVESLPCIEYSIRIRTKFRNDSVRLGKTYFHYSINNPRLLLRSVRAPLFPRQSFSLMFMVCILDDDGRGQPTNQAFPSKIELQMHPS